MNIAKAMYLGGRIIYASDKILDYNSYEDLGLRCYVCGEPVHFKKGEEKKPHFAHFPSVDPKQVEVCELRVASYGNDIANGVRSFVEDKGQRLKIFQSHFIEIVANTIPNFDQVVQRVKESAKVSQVPALITDVILYFVTHSKSIVKEYCQVYQEKLKHITVLQKKISWEAIDFLCIKSSHYLIGGLLYFYYFSSPDKNSSINGKNDYTKSSFFIIDTIINTKWVESYRVIFTFNKNFVQQEKKVKTTTHAISGVVLTTANSVTSPTFEITVADNKILVKVKILPNGDVHLLDSDGTWIGQLGMYSVRRVERVKWDALKGWGNIPKQIAKYLSLHPEATETDLIALFPDISDISLDTDRKILRGTGIKNEPVIITGKPEITHIGQFSHCLTAVDQATQALLDAARSKVESWFKKSAGDLATIYDNYVKSPETKVKTPVTSERGLGIPNLRAREKDAQGKARSPKDAIKLLRRVLGKINTGDFTFDETAYKFVRVFTEDEIETIATVLTAKLGPVQGMSLACPPEASDKDKYLYSLVKAIKLYAGVDAAIKGGDQKYTWDMENKFLIRWLEKVIPTLRVSGMRMDVATVSDILKGVKQYNANKAVVNKLPEIDITGSENIEVKYLIEMP